MSYLQKLDNNLKSAESGALIRLIATGLMTNRIIHKTENQENKSQYVRVLPCKCNEKVELYSGDLIRIDYLAMKNIDAIKSIQLFQCEADDRYELYVEIPGWMIRYFIDDSKTRVWKGYQMIHLGFLQNMILRGKIRINCNDNDENDAFLVLCNTLLESEKRRTNTLKLTDFVYNEFHIGSETDFFKKNLCFAGLSRNFMVYNNYIDKIEHIKLSSLGRVLMYYDQMLLNLYGKRKGDCVELFWNCKNIEGWADFNRLNEGLTVEIKWSMPITGPCYFGTLRTNSIKLQDGLCARSFLPRTGGKSEEWFSCFSLTKEKYRADTYIEGYWREGNWNEYPVPKPSDNPVSKELLDKLCAITSEYASRTNYLGLSKCRICGIMNGCGEYTLKNKDGVTFRYPEGLMHYLKEHNIHISKEFQEFLDSDLVPLVSLDPLEIIKNKSF